MIWVDRLPCYSWEELEKLMKSLPSFPFMTIENITSNNYWMNSYNISFCYYIKEYFEDKIDDSYKIGMAQHKLQNSIKYNMNYIKEKHCKIS